MMRKFCSKIWSSHVLRHYIALFFLFFFLSTAASWAAGRKPPEPHPSVNTPLSKPLPITVEECYALALKQSESLAIRKVDINKTWTDFMAATGVVVGDMDFVITDFRQKAFKGGIESGGETGTLSRVHTRERRFEISQPLFQGFKALGALTGAGALRDLRIEEKKRAEQLLFANVVNAFYDALRYQNDVRITEDILLLFKDRIKDLREREDIGRSRASEGITAEARMKTIEANLAEMKGAYRMQLHILEFLTGVVLERRELRDSQRGQTLPDDLEVYVHKIEMRPDVKAADLEAKISKRSFIVAQSDLWPTISLDGKLYEKREGFRDGIDWDLLFTMRFPIYKGGDALGQTLAAAAEVKKSNLSHQLIERTAELEVKQAYEQWKSAFERFQALEGASKAQEDNYKFQKEDYAHSLVSNLDVLEALETMNDTRLEANRAKYDLKKSMWNFKVAVGDCCELI